MSGKKKKESEGIALLSMYYDEEEDDDDDEDMVDTVPEEEEKHIEDNNMIISSDVNPLLDTATPPSVSVENSPPSQQQQQKQQQQQLFGSRRKGIVDYGHEDAAFSPDPDPNPNDGADLQTVNGTPPGTVQVLTPSTQSTPYESSEFLSQSQSDAIKDNIIETPDEAVDITEDTEKETDPLDKFLPPPPNTKCSDELQEKIIKFLTLKKKTGKSFNSEVRNRKEYRNPDFLLHAVTYQDIDQIGSCFSKDVFDPHGYDKSDYYDEIEADLKRELERKEQEKKKSQKIDFLSVGTQSALPIPTPKVMPIPALPPVSANVDVGTREGRPNKKSKWDKVDGDARHPLLTSGQDLVSAAITGSGYTAFAQRQKEAEERRSSDRKLDRRS